MMEEHKEELEIKNRERKLGEYADRDNEKEQ